jgi:TonB family protein
LIRFGKLAVFVELLYVTPHYRRFTLPIPNINPLSFISISIAALAHLSLLVSAYAFKDFTIRPPGTMPVSRFVEVMIEEQPDKEIEEPEEELEEEAEAPSEEAVEPSNDAPTLPPPPDDAPAPREEARRVAQERFGKGEAAVKALASFLSGETKGSGLSLGDASAALGSGSGALALGSAFGDAGGDISLGGGGGGAGLDTSTGLGGAKRAGQLKAKRRTRKVRGRVKTLKSTMRARGSNGLSKEQVLKAIRKSQVRIAACYERQLLKSPNISGMLTLSWEITPQGKVKSAREVTSSLGSPALTSCVMKVIKRARFPSSKGKTKVKYPFVFQQG